LGESIDASWGVRVFAVFDPYGGFCDGTAKRDSDLKEIEKAPLL
jgi:hypothetical protein